LIIKLMQGASLCFYRKTKKSTEY